MVPERVFRVNFWATFSWCAPLLLLCTCASGLHNGVFSKSGIRYEVGSPPSGFHSVGVEDNDLAYAREGTGQSIALDSTCRAYDDAPLSVLTHHLLMGFTQVETKEQKLFSMDGREGLKTHVIAKLDGVPMEMMFVVMKKDGCVFDLTYLSPPDRFEEQLPQFEALLSRFHVQEP